MISDALHFEQISKLMDISVEQIRDLNPQYRSDIVPAGFGKSYALRVPYNHVGEFIDKQDTIFAYNRNTYFNDSDRTADPKIVSRNTLMPMLFLVIRLIGLHGEEW